MTTLAATQAPLFSFGTKPRAAAAPRIGFVKRIQIAQMARALNLMADAQLEKIGVNRADIPAAARRMVLAD